MTTLSTLLRQPGVERTVKRIREFVELPVGWNYGAGVPIDRGIANLALLGLSYGLGAGFSRTNAFPCEDGGVIISFYHEDHEIDLRLHVDGGADFDHYTDRRSIKTATVVPATEAFSLIQEAAKSLRLSGWLISVTTGTTNEIASTGALFYLARKVAESPSSTRDAPPNEAVQFVHIFDITTQKFRAIPQFSGSSIQRSSGSMEWHGMWSAPQASQDGQTHRWISTATAN